MKLTVTLCILLAATVSYAQVGYQGFLKDGGNPANGLYIIEVKMYDALTGGNLIASHTVQDVPVTDGIFSFNLPWGSAQFTGGPRYLQISVVLSPGGGLTLLGPRQQLRYTPYAIRSIDSSNADNLGGVAANQFVQTGSSEFIRNGTAVQIASDFSISGIGRADSFTA